MGSAGSLIDDITDDDGYWDFGHTTLFINVGRPQAVD